MDTVHCQVKYFNNVVEADHGKLKQLIRPVYGFETMKTVHATIKGSEIMRTSRKGQANHFNLSNDILGEARIVERAFGVGTGAIAEVVSVLGKRVQSSPAGLTGKMGLSTAPQNFLQQSPWGNDPLR